MKHAERDTVLASVEEFLAYLEVAAPQQKDVIRSMRVRLTAFKHAEPETGDFSGLSGVQRAIYLDETDNPARLLPSFDVATIGTGVGSDETFILNRVRTLQPRETRGRIHPWTPHAVAVSIGYVSELGVYRAGEVIYGYVGGQWRSVDCRTKVDWRETLEWTEIVRDGRVGHLGMIGYHHQLAVYRPLLWHVAIGYAASGASLLIPCAASAVLDLFRYRDLPAGKQRRDALLHWVSAHWRHTISAPETSLHIAQHLRGQTYFPWRDGLCVRILPSEDDKKLVQAHHKHAADPVAPR